MLLSLLLACPPAPEDSAEDSVPVGTGRYEVAWTVDPDPPVAGEPTELAFTIYGPDGTPVEDLQQSHERMVHNLFISRDLESFQHLHQEDFAAVTADDLRTASFHLPVTFPLAGDFRLAFDYAAENQYLNTVDWVGVTGAPAQLDAPVEDDAVVREVADLRVTLSWLVAPVAGFEGQWRVTLTDLDGNPITDLVQYLGADAHCILVPFDLAEVSHTHAWVPDMENTPPGHDMPHLYDGPDIDFHYTFTRSGRAKMWVQFARAAAPDDPYTVDFQFVVG